MTLLLHWLLAFCLTQLVEIPIYLRPLLRTRPPRAAFAIAFGASAWTHPVVAFVIPALWCRFFEPVYYRPGQTELTGAFALRALAFALGAEAFAIVGEALYLRAFAVARPLKWALIANLTSSTLGALLTFLTGWP